MTARELSSSTRLPPSAATGHKHRRVCRSLRSSSSSTTVGASLCSLDQWLDAWMARHTTRKAAMRSATARRSSRGLRQLACVAKTSRTTLAAGLLTWPRASEKPTPPSSSNVSMLPRDLAAIRWADALRQALCAERQRPAFLPSLDGASSDALPMADVGLLVAFPSCYFLFPAICPTPTGPLEHGGCCCAAATRKSNGRLSDRCTQYHDAHPIERQVTQL